MQRFRAVSFAERHAKREQGEMWWTMSSPHNGRLLARGLPNAMRCCMHIEQPYLLTAVTSHAIDTECRQKAVYSEEIR
jgi:hypothetical protein